MKIFFQPSFDADACKHVVTLAQGPLILTAADNLSACCCKAKEALSLLDQASSALQPNVATLCLRGQCCSALGNNAVVRPPSVFSPTSTPQ